MVVITWTICAVALIGIHHYLRAKTTRTRKDQNDYFLALSKHENDAFLAALQNKVDEAAKVAEAMQAARDGADQHHAEFRKLLEHRRMQLDEQAQHLAYNDEQLVRWEKVRDDLEAWNEEYPSYLFQTADGGERGQG